MMRTYYRGSDALVTDDYFVWRTSSTQIFAVPDLRNIVIVRGPLNASSPGPALATGAGLFLLAVAGWISLGPAVGYTAAAAAVVITLTVLSLSGRRTARMWHLLASYHGGMVTIYSSSDERVFNQVTRALRRSTENLGRSRSREDLAAA
jgi:hypothetical protein